MARNFKSRGESNASCRKLYCSRTAISKDAQKIWEDLMFSYNQMPQPILNNLDRKALQQYCEAVATWDLLEEKYITLRDHVDELDELGTRTLENLIPLMNNQALICSKLEDHLMIGPESRLKAGICKKKKDEDNAFAEFIKRKQESNEQELRS